MYPPSLPYLFFSVHLILIEQVDFYHDLHFYHVSCDGLIEGFPVKAQDSCELLGFLVSNCLRGAMIVDFLIDVSSW